MYTFGCQFIKGGIFSRTPVKKIFLVGGKLCAQGGGDNVLMILPFLTNFIATPLFVSIS